jgi:hypothetical protein
MVICRNRIAGKKRGSRTYSGDCVGSPKETENYPVFELK